MDSDGVKNKNKNLVAETSHLVSLGKMELGGRSDVFSVSNSGHWWVLIHFGKGQFLKINSKAGRYL